MIYALSELFSPTTYCSVINNIAKDTQSHWPTNHRGGGGGGGGYSSQLGPLTLILPWTLIQVVGVPHSDNISHCIHSFPPTQTPHNRACLLNWRLPMYLVRSHIEQVQKMVLSSVQSSFAIHRSKKHVASKSSFSLHSGGKTQGGYRRRPYRPCTSTCIFVPSLLVSTMISSFVLIVMSQKLR